MLYPIRFVFQQLIVAVDFMHKKGKVHRNLGLSSIIISDSGQLPIVKLSDFSFAVDKYDSLAKAQTGKRAAASLNEVEVARRCYRERM